MLNWATCPGFSPTTNTTASALRPAASMPPSHPKRASGRAPTLRLHAPPAPTSWISLNSCPRSTGTSPEFRPLRMTAEQFGELPGEDDNRHNSRADGGDQYAAGGDFARGLE